jgi:hypothetical protein
MELVWDNPSPNRTLDRPAIWEVVARDGTTSVISVDEIQAFADRKTSHGVNEIVSGLESLASLYFCF